MSIDVHNRIRTARESKGLKQDIVAAEIGISQAAYGKIERGENDVNTKRLLQIAKVLDVNICDFFEDRTVADRKIDYGYVTRDEFGDLLRQVRKLTQEIQNLKTFTVGAGNKKKKRKKR
ncbi:MAG TPA: helix-turn-helix transcriptional regulator [Bacteroidia bacterium]|nr:helix-turn-helix transcriptional regulator [Bacteroidia bacterium]